MTPTAIATPEMRGLQTPVNSTPAGFDPSRDFPRGFMDFFRPLHERLTPRQQELALRRVEGLQASLESDKTPHHFPSHTVRHCLRITLPDWGRHQRKHKNGTPDDGGPLVKMFKPG